MSEPEPADGEGLFPQSRPEIDADDWDDQDLLTRAEASLRLERSARLARAELARLGSTDPAATAALEIQIRRIEAVLANIRDR